MNEKRSRDEIIFDGALLLPVEQRAAYVKVVSLGESNLEQRVLRLLQAHEQRGGPLDEPPVAPAPKKTIALSLPPAEKPGERIGPYKILQLLGEGGCGMVYMAEQEQPVRRRVALKVIKLGMDTKNVVARFEAERQALALMDHPNIAKVFDAGATETGRPFFVMELVRGIRITDYCDQNNLTTAQRLELFVQVCHAIQHAHQKGIIHRDIKPSNILVTLHDGVAVPKVIDFGIAKATDHRLTDKTVFTQFEQFIGTPAYMSPEQAEMSGLDIDTRSDIYSLGVLLYELLTGHTPFDPKELMAAGLDAMRRLIREQEPQRPSTRLSTMQDADLTTVAKRRKTEPPRLITLVRGDLDWIVMKCLEKDRTRRYETSNGLALDIQRHLSNEAVSARPPSELYRFQKMVRRNRFAFAATAAVLLALVTGAAVSTWQAVRATKAEKRTRILMSQLYFGLFREMAQFETPKVSVLEDKISGTNVTVFFPFQTTPTTNAAARKLLYDVLQHLDSASFQDVPDLEAEIREMVAMLCAQQGEWDKAETLVRQSLALEKRILSSSDPKIGDISTWLGFLLVRRGEWSEAESLFRDALVQKTKLFGESSPETASPLNWLGVVHEANGDLQGAQAMFQKALVAARKGQAKEPSKANATLGDAILNLADVLRAQQAYGEALPLAEEAVAFYHDHPTIQESTPGKSMLLLGEVSEGKHDYANARKWYREAADLGNPQAQNDLGWLYRTGTGVETNFVEAVRLFREAAIRGDARAQDNLGVMYRDGLGVTNDKVEAVSWFRRAAEQGDADGQVNLGWMLENGYGVSKEAAEALKWYRKAAEQGDAEGENDLGWLYRIGFGVETNFVEAVRLFHASAEKGNALGQNNLGVMYRDGLGTTQDNAEAAKWFRKAAEQGDPYGASNLAWMYDQGRGVDKNAAEATQWYRRSAEHGDANSQCQLGWRYANAVGVTQDLAEALKWYRKSADQGYSNAQAALGWCYHIGSGAVKDDMEAIRWFRKAAEQGDAYAQYNLGAIYTAGHGTTNENEVEAVKWLRKSADQAYPDAQTWLAWLLATSDDPKVRDGATAVIYAERAVTSSHRKDPNALSTLAAAYAGTGQFINAVSVQKEAIGLVNDDKLKQLYLERLRLFEANTPIRTAK